MSVGSDLFLCRSLMPVVLKAGVKAGPDKVFERPARPTREHCLVRHHE